MPSFEMAHLNLGVTYLKNHQINEAIEVLENYIRNNPESYSAYFNLGLTLGYSSLIAPVAGSSPVLFVVLSRFVFKEPLTGQQKTGIIFALAGIVLIGISTI